MVYRKFAGVILTLCVAGCGAAPASAPATNFASPAPTVTQTPAPTTSVATDPGTDATDPGADPTTDDGSLSSDIGASPSPDPSASPSDSAPVPTIGTGAGTAPRVIPLKNSIFKDWQATGIVAVGGQIYLAASDRTGLSQRGTVLTQDAKGNWTDIGSTLLGLKHPLNNTVRGIAADASGNLVALEAAGHLGQVTTTPKPSIRLITGHPSGLLDVVCVNNTFYMSLGNQIRKLSPDLTSSEAVASNLSLTGGMGADKDGNFYAIATGQVLKIAKDGSTKSIVVDDVSNAVDVAIDKNGRIIVLMTNVVQIFDANGQKLQDVGGGLFDHGTAIYIDSNNTVYVSDSGKDKKTSQILTFSL